jgi:Fe-S cluster biosynthesis and repair protein YggX
MSAQPDLDKLNAEQFAVRCREAMIPVSNKFSYFTALPLSEEDIKEYVEDPVAALPAGLAASLPSICIALVPYLEKLNGKDKGDGPGDTVSFEKPPESRQAGSAKTIAQGQATLLFAMKDRPVADYHYYFYRAVATMAADRAKEDQQGQFFSLLREELRGRVHGEVDQEGWRLKEALLRRQTNLRRETKLFREYAQQAFVDTLTLYLHGLCCDIDVEPGPRQLPSRYLRKRLVLLESIYPPPAGSSVFPEGLSQP